MACLMGTTTGHFLGLNPVFSPGERATKSGTVQKPISVSLDIYGTALQESQSCFYTRQEGRDTAVLPPSGAIQAAAIFILCVESNGGGSNNESVAIPHYGGQLIGLSVRLLI